MDILKLKEQRAEKIKAAKAIRDAAKAAERDLTEDEGAQIDSLLDEADTFAGQIKKAEEAEARMSRIDDATAEVDSPTPRKTSPDDPAKQMVVGKDLREDDPTGGFANFGELAHAVRRAYHPGQRVIDDRLRILNAASGQAEFGGEEGGFFVGTTYSNALYKRATETLNIIPQCDVVVIGGDANSLEVTAAVDHNRSGTTYRYGGVVVYWIGEASQFTSSALKTRKVRLELHKLGALAYVTEEELSDANISFGNRLLGKMGEAIGDELVEVLMFGNGVGRPLGAFASPACLSVSKETGQDADTIVFENIVKMEARLAPECQAKAQWYYNQTCHPQLRTMSVAVGTGGIPVLWGGGGAGGTGKATLDSIPVTRTEHCETLGDAGDIVLGDWSKYLFASKGNIKTAMSIHLRFDYDETAFKATYRCDGRPVWEQALTPRKGADTVSPFVKLAERA